MPDETDPGNHAITENSSVWCEYENCQNHAMHRFKKKLNVPDINFKSMVSSLDQMREVTADQKE
jgi:hypothetical protein